jgi:NADH dehydrogenase (ubiquinone) Fe-S protein 3
MNQQLVVIKHFQSLVKICPIEKLQIIDDTVIMLVRPHMLYNTLLFFKNHVLHQFKVLNCISCVDYPTKKYRFKLIYELLSIRYNFRIRIKTFSYELLGINSIEKLFLTSGWYECEIWDMFGVFFNGHSNLKRILTDYGFEGYPLRKDFPLSGFIEMRYNETQKRVISESIELAQEHRTFAFLSPWDQKEL